MNKSFTFPHHRAFVRSIFTAFANVLTSQVDEHEVKKQASESSFFSFSSSFKYPVGKQVRFAG